MLFDMPPVTQALILANVLVFVLETLIGSAAVTRFALWPLGPQFQPWQLLTYAFLHGSVWHLLLNMFALYMFGSDLERVWGPRRYLLYYVVCVLAAALSQIAFAATTAAHYPTIGASGGVFGLLLAFALYFPQRMIVLLFPPIPMPAWLFATLYGVIELVSGVAGLAGGVAHFAHLGGMLGGFLLIRYWRSSWARWRRR
jgi:membrane associated rhomboid family serine protease